MANPLPELHFCFPLVLLRDSSGRDSLVCYVLRAQERSCPIGLVNVTRCGLARMSSIGQIFIRMKPVFAAVVCAGCSHQPTHFANPLYSADRVPPPSTRTMAPGTAQPYYSGDPLPAMPSGQSSTAPTRPSDSLNWTTPTTTGTAVVPAASSGESANVQLVPASFNGS